MKVNLTLCIIFLPVFIWAQQPIVIKNAAAPVIYTLQQGEKKVFLISLRKNKTYTIRAEQKGIDISLTLKDKQGHTLRYKDSTNGAWGPEIILWKPGVTAIYTLAIAPLADVPKDVSGRFSIMLEQSQALDSHTHLVTILSPREMKEDLTAFRSIRDSANSGFYRYRSKKQIDSIYSWAGNQIMHPLNILGFYKIIAVLTDFEGSIHNWRGLPYDTQYYLTRSKGFFPYCLKYIEGKIVINTVGKKIPLGSRVLSINGVVDTMLISSMYKYTTTDGYNVTRKRLTSMDRFGIKYQIEYGVKDRFIIRYLAPGSTKVLTSIAKSISMADQDKNYAVRHSKGFEDRFDPAIQGTHNFKLLNDSTALLSFLTFSMANGDQDPQYKVFSRYLDSIFKFMNYRNQIKDLIIDIRNNGGGTDPTFEKAFSYLTNHAFKENNFAYVIFNKIALVPYFDWSSADKENQQREQTNYAYWLKDNFPVFSNGKYFQNQKYNPVWYPDSNRFKGKIYLLINENTASAASHFASLVKAYSDATIVGMETGGGYYGHNGHTAVQYILPHSKIKTEFSIVFVEQDAPKKASQPFGRGVIPDYEISQTFDDFLDNQDTQMQFVLKLIRHF